jgi:hypothetical protein
LKALIRDKKERTYIVSGTVKHLLTGLTYEFKAYFLLVFICT